MKGFEFTIVGRVDARTMDDARLAVAKVVRQLDNYTDESGNLITDCGYDVRFFTPAQQAADARGGVSLVGGVSELEHGNSEARSRHDYPALPAPRDDGERDS